MYTIRLWHPHPEIEERLKRANYKVGEELEAWQVGDFVRDLGSVNLNAMFVGNEVFVDTRLFRQR